MTTPKLYLLDTNILVALIRAGPVGQYVETTYALTTQPFRPLVSVVSVGETLKLTKRLGWSDVKISRMQELLQNLVRVDIGHPQVLEAYAEIACHCEQSHSTKPQNDYWIAATANVTGALLLTTDKHFDSLQGKFVERIWIDEEAIKRGSA